jgi:hypothetical protein
MRSSRQREAPALCAVLLLVLVVFRPPAAAAEAAAAASEDAAWLALEAHYHSAVREVAADFARQGKELEDREAALRSTLAAREPALAALHEKFTRREHLRSRLDTRACFGVSGYLAFPILLVHLLLYLARAKDPPFPFRLALVAAAALLTLFALPAFAADLGQDLGDTSALVGASPAAKGLYWLGHLQGEGTMPVEIAVTDPLLTPYRELRRGSAEYHFTRAALLWETGKRDDALATLREVVQATPQGEPTALYVRTIRVLAREDAAALPEVAPVLILRIANPGALTELALALTQAGKQALGKKAAEWIAAVALRTADLLAPIAAFYAAGQRELATPLVVAAVTKAQNPGDVVPLLTFALARADRPLAITVIEQAVVRFGKPVADLAIEDPALLYPKEELPGETEISLAVLLGELNEKEGIPAGARPAYDHAAAGELERILDQAAFAFPARLRSFFYVERFWRQQGEDGQLRMLRPIYERVQEETLAGVAEKIRREETERLGKRRSELAALEERAGFLEKEVDTTVAALRHLTARIALGIAHLLAIAAAALLILWGCALHARTRAAGAAFQRSVLVWRFTEALGWVLAFSVIGAWVGLPLVLLARLAFRGLPASAVVAT